MKQRNLVNPGGAPVPRQRRIGGVHPVSEWLRAKPQHLLTIHYDPQAANRIANLLHLAAAAGVPTQPCSARVLTSLLGGTRHQGVVATCLPYPYIELDQLVATAAELLILADQIQDPHNLGALLRSAEGLGAGAVLTPKDASVPVTAAVEAAAAGAAAFLPVCRVTNAARTLRTLKGHGYWIAGLIPAGGVGIFGFDPPKPLVLVVGGEAGMRSLVVRHCDVLVSIPMVGRVESLNASVAAAIALYHVRQQWGRLTGTSG
jgi:23S rRNA (guanosine2251-2'-O)-methyltransferase